MIKLLGLDLAQHICGWCFWREGMATPRYGRWILPKDFGDELEKLFFALRVKLREFNAVENLADATFIIEAPLLLHVRDNRKRARINLGLANEASTTALELEATPRDTEHSDLYAWWVGTAYPRKSGWDNTAYGKHLSMLAARRLGFTPKDDNASDAIGLVTHYAAIWNIDVPWDTKRCPGPQFLELHAQGRIVSGG